MSSRESYQRHREQYLKRAMIYRREHPEIYKKNAARYQEMRKDLMRLLGGKCAWCGFDKDVRALTIDHIYDDGKVERKEKGKSGYSFYIFYSKHPKLARRRLQVLCYNCNNIKRLELSELGRKKKKLSAIEELIVKEKL